jgi:hypothetical protein
VEGTKVLIFGAKEVPKSSVGFGGRVGGEDQPEGPDLTGHRRSVGMER